MVRPPNLQDVSKWHIRACVSYYVALIQTSDDQSFKGSGGGPRDDFQGGHDFKITIIVRPLPRGSNKAKS